jgi:ankyrin repeat protein
VNARDAHGITPLLAAIWEGHTDVVKILLAHVSVVVVVLFCNYSFIGCK